MVEASPLLLPLSCLRDEGGSSLEDVSDGRLQELNDKRTHAGHVHEDDVKALTGLPNRLVIMAVACALLQSTIDSFQEGKCSLGSCRAAEETLTYGNSLESHNFAFSF